MELTQEELSAQWSRLCHGDETLLSQWRQKLAEEIQKMKMPKKNDVDMLRCSHVEPLDLVEIPVKVTTVFPEDRSVPGINVSFEDDEVAEVRHVKEIVQAVDEKKVRKLNDFDEKKASLKWLENVMLGKVTDIFVQDKVRIMLVRVHKSWMSDREEMLSMRTDLLYTLAAMETLREKNQKLQETIRQKDKQIRMLQKRMNTLENFLLLQQPVKQSKGAVIPSQKSKMTIRIESESKISRNQARLEFLHRSIAHHERTRMEMEDDPRQWVIELEKLQKLAQPQSQTLHNAFVDGAALPIRRKSSVGTSLAKSSLLDVQNDDDEENQSMDSRLQSSDYRAELHSLIKGVGVMGRNLQLKISRGLQKQLPDLCPDDISLVTDSVHAFLQLYLDQIYHFSVRCIGQILNSEWNLRHQGKAEASTQVEAEEADKLDSQAVKELKVKLLNSENKFDQSMDAAKMTEMRQKDRNERLAEWYQLLQHRVIDFHRRVFVNLRLVWGNYCKWTDRLMDPASHMDITPTLTGENVMLNDVLSTDVLHLNDLAMAINPVVAKKYLSPTIDFSSGSVVIEPFLDGVDSGSFGTANLTSTATKGVGGTLRASSRKAAARLPNQKTVETEGRSSSSERVNSHKKQLESSDKALPAEGWMVKQEECWVKHRGKGRLIRLLCKACFASLCEECHKAQFEFFGSLFNEDEGADLKQKELQFTDITYSSGCHPPKSPSGVKDSPGLRERLFGRCRFGQNAPSQTQDQCNQPVTSYTELLKSALKSPRSERTTVFPYRSSHQPHRERKQFVSLNGTVINFSEK